jgi:hypothetical protein
MEIIQLTLFDIKCQVPESGYPKLLVTICPKCNVKFAAKVVKSKKKVKFKKGFYYELVPIDTGIKLQFCKCIN